MAAKARKKWKKQDWIDLILVLICVPILIIGLAVSLSIYQTKQSGGVPTVLGYACFTVMSGSMEPELMIGESFMCKTSVKPSEIKEGDIISFYNGKKVITHKVYHVLTKKENQETKYYFITYGVNNKNSKGEYIYDDYVVTEESFIGRYAGSTNLNGFIGFLTSKWGMFCFVIIPLGVLIFTDIFTLLSYIKPKKKVLADGALAGGTLADGAPDGDTHGNEPNNNLDNNINNGLSGGGGDLPIYTPPINGINNTVNNRVNNTVDNNSLGNNVQNGAQGNKKPAAAGKYGGRAKAASKTTAAGKNQANKNKRPKKGNRKKRKSRKK